MDALIIKQLEEVGGARMLAGDSPVVAIEVDEAGRVRPIGDNVKVVAGSSAIQLNLKPANQLFTGTKVPPSFRQGPTEAYVAFFAAIESTVIEYCRAAGRAEYDSELERLYNHLRRRPDGTDANPLFSYMRAAARLYMSAVDVSNAEYDAVCRRLAKSASTFSMGPSSTNYCEVVASGLGA